MYCPVNLRPVSLRPVIVTRPLHDAAVWVAKLQQQGFKAQSLPLIAITAVSSAADASALQAAQNSLHSYSACMFVSSNAVEHFFTPFLESNRGIAKVLPSHTAPNNVAFDIPRHIRFLAPGPGTGTALRAAGVPASQIDMPPPDAAQFDSEALWLVIGQRDWQGTKVLIVRGKNDSQADSPNGGAGTGRDWLIQQLLACGGTVDMVCSYQRGAPELSSDQVDAARAASQDGSIWLFSSSEAVANLVGQPGLKNVSWQGALAVATHPRIQAAARAAGWGVVQSSRPAIEDIVAALRSIESTPP